MFLNSTLIIQFLAFFLLIGFTIKFIWPNLIKLINERKIIIKKGIYNFKKNKLIINKTKKYINLKIKSLKKKKYNYLNKLKIKKNIIINKSKIIAKKEIINIINNLKLDIEILLLNFKKKLNNKIINLTIICLKNILKKKYNPIFYFKNLKFNEKF